MVGIDCEYIPGNATSDTKPAARPDVRRVYCEIMQIGACKLDAQGREIQTLNLVVQAHRIEKVPAWLCEMTGMTDEKRARGTPFPKALEQLAKFIDGEETWVFNSDWWVLQANAEAHGVRSPFSTPFLRLKPLLDEAKIGLPEFKRHGFTEVCSGGLYQVLGIRLPHIEGVGPHDALHDARSLIHSVHHLRGKT